VWSGLERSRIRGLIRRSSPARPCAQEESALSRRSAPSLAMSPSAARSGSRRDTRQKSARRKGNSRAFQSRRAHGWRWPVKRRRSGMTSQRGVSEGHLLHGGAYSPTQREKVLSRGGGRTKEAVACPNLAARLEGEKRCRTARRICEYGVVRGTGVGAYEKEKGRASGWPHDPEKDQKDIGFRHGVRKV